MKYITHSADLCVVGGGLAGICAALAAARHGSKVVLMQDRGVLGGNASSEIRMWICGAHGQDRRETGILEELILENFYRNPQHSYPLWDAVLYDKVASQEHLTLLLNTACFDAQMEDGRIVSVRGYQSPCETMHTVEATFFADCSGDSVLSTLTGAHYRYGREARDEFSESIAPKTADAKTMGMSCLFQARETDAPKPFTPPPFAYSYPTDADLPFREHDLSSNFWWIETGGEGDCIHDTDACRTELLKIAYGVWDHVKNHGDHGAENWELEWIGLLPGKRESRRYIGRYTVTQNDVSAGGKFPDTVAYAGWSMDDHFPAGFAHKTSYPTIFHPAPSPWGIPFRALYSENVPNLLFAGRNISVTHAALSSSRVMGTCALLGQAIGTAAAQMIQEHTTPDTLHIARLQKTLQADDCDLPGFAREISPLSRQIFCNQEIVRNGNDRGEENLWRGGTGEFLLYESETPFSLRGVRLVFDSDLNRNYHNMPCHIRLREDRYVLPKTLLRDFDLLLTDAHGQTTCYPYRDVHCRLLTLPFTGNYTAVRFVPRATYGSTDFRVFSFEIL